MKKQPKIIDKFIASNGFTIELAPDSTADVHMTAAELRSAKFVNAKELLPPEFFGAIEEMRKKRCVKKLPLEHSKQRITLSLDKSIISVLHDIGRGYGARVEHILHTAIEQGQL